MTLLSGDVGGRPGACCLSLPSGGLQGLLSDNSRLTGPVDRATHLGHPLVLKRVSHPLDSGKCSRLKVA